MTELSSVDILFPLKMIPSTLMISPVYTWTTSPTKSSYTLILTIYPFLTTLTFFLAATSFNFLNCLSFMYSLPAVTALIMQTAKIIETPSSHPDLSPWVIIPRIKEAKAAKHKIWMVWSSKVERIISKRVLGSLTIGSLLPYFLSLYALSYELGLIPFFLFVLRTLSKPS